MSLFRLGIACGPRNPRLFWGGLDLMLVLGLLVAVGCGVIGPRFDHVLNEENKSGLARVPPAPPDSTPPARVQLAPTFTSPTMAWQAPPAGAAGDPNLGHTRILEGIPAGLQIVTNTTGQAGVAQQVARGAEHKPTRAPQGWHRDRRRPSFARVYVGDGNALELVSLQVTVTVEGPRARTVVDHIFRNPHDRRLEGTFEYPLPSGASPSYFAMFAGQAGSAVPPRFGRHGDLPPLPQAGLSHLTPQELVKQVSSADWGKLQEARVVGKEKALDTYEETVRSQIDPALLEYAGGNTFSGRVFPIAPKGYNRVLIAYEELLPCTQAGVQYHFPLPGRKLERLRFTLQASAADCGQAVFRPAGVQKVADGRLTCTRVWKNETPAGEVLFAFHPPHAQIQAISGRPGENGPHYLYARVRPDLKVEAARPFAEHAVFLLDTSLSEHPDRFAVNLRLLRAILKADPDIKRFNILTFDVAGRWLEPDGWLENSPAGRKKAFRLLDGIVLEGATDLSAALDRLARPEFAIRRGTPLNVFLLSDGQITWGESDVSRLAANFEARCPWPTRFHCYRTGLGADNLELFEALTRKGGGVFNCFGNADLNAAAAAHRHHCFQVERVRLVGGPAASDILVAGRKAAIYPGGELVVVARLASTGRTRLIVEGTFLGNKQVREFPLEVNGDGELAPRGWAEVAVAGLLALNDPKLDNLATAYCQEFGIASRAASFLALENEADYKRLNLEAERGQTVPGGDLQAFLDATWHNLARVVSARQGFERFLAQVGPRVHLLDGSDGPHVKKLLALLKEQEFELPDSDLAGAIRSGADVPTAYLSARQADPRQVALYVAEARRRAAAGDVSGAIRVLSSVVEQYPGRADALRLVGYRLLDLRQPAHAARLFQQVQRNRPFEPHSYRDLARSLEECGKYGLAALQYEIVLAGTWHNRFHESLKVVAREEYAQMMQQAIRRKAIGKQLKDHFGERLEHMSADLPRGDLRVTISWNTDATDVDLWVIEPDGTKCFYQHNRTNNGGELSQDQTQGYGPERYQMIKASPGVYTVIVHYFGANPNLLAGETHVQVVVTRHAGSPEEVTERHNVILKKQNEQVEVCRVKF